MSKNLFIFNAFSIFEEIIWWRLLRGIWISWTIISNEQAPIHAYYLPLELLLRMKIIKNLILILTKLTLTRPIGLPPHAPVARKIADQRWIIANSAKNRCLFYIKWCDHMWLTSLFFSPISNLRISYKIIWLKTWSCYETHWKMKSGRA